MSSKEKTKALEMAISQIEKSFGKGAIMRLGAEEITEGIQVIPSGSLALDIATGIGGFPRGRVIEIFGPESSGKTTLALNAIAQAQKGGGTAAFIDAEHALDITYPGTYPTPLLTASNRISSVLKFRGNLTHKNNTPYGSFHFALLGKYASRDSNITSLFFL